jgi:glycosyltransferase involved in cell wall biosynthesis
VSSSSSVALVHDYLLVMRGAERTFAAMADCWPEAPIYTLLYDEEGTEGRFSGRDVRTSYLQRLGVGQRGFRMMLPAFPRAIRSLPLEGYDTVISSSSAFAHGVRTSPDASHCCYLHSPFRYAWFEEERALGEVAAPLRPVLKGTLGRIRAKDLAAAPAVTRFVSNSAITRERLASLWGCDSNVVHPPVGVERFQPSAHVEDYFLVVTELVRHKRVELALEASERAGVELRVVGDGPERERLERRYGPPGGKARFLGRVGDEALVGLYARARAFVLPNVEEFGIAAVEAQAAGRPVLAVAAGGALETVLDDRTGVLVPEGDVDAMAAAMRAHDFERFNPAEIVRHADNFSTEVFQRRLRAEVSSS